MDVALAVEMLLFDAERAAYAAVVIHPVPERAVVGLKPVAAPGSPAGEFALGFDMQIGAAQECRIGRIVHLKNAFGCSVTAVKSDPGGSRRPFAGTMPGLLKTPAKSAFPVRLMSLIRGLHRVRA